ncbi:MAG: hypothetical protein ACRBBP_01510 [Bdellovibrionales bacterium]
MPIFFIAISLSLFGASLYLATWTSSVIFSLVLILIIWTRLFSNRIIKKNFKGLTPLKNTDLHYAEKNIQEAFSNSYDVNHPQVYLDPTAKNLQLYCFGDKKTPQIITSKLVLEELTQKDLNSLLNYTGKLHSENAFKNKQPLVAFLVYVGSIGRYIDTALSFMLGIKTIKGEPKALVRKPLYFFLNKLNFTRKQKASESSLRNYSYLSFQHKNPILGPLSTTDRLL